MTDTSIFPDSTYADTVLGPLFDGVKTHFADHMAMIDRAHLVMLKETGIIGSADSAKLAQAVQAAHGEVDLENLTYTGEFEDYFFWVEAELRKHLGDLGGALHTARSRNDIDHTVFRMGLLARSQAMMGQVLTLIQALLSKAEQESETLIVAYTHGQPAQATTFGHYLAAMIEVLLRDAKRLSDAIDVVDRCPLGAAAITTSGFPIDRARTADLLGFDGSVQNSYGCIASVDYITGLYSAIKLMFLHLGRTVQDMAFWSSFEVGQLYVPNALVQISSIMPQKRNPVPIEHLRHLSSVTVGHCDTMMSTMHNTPFTDMNDSEGEVQQAGYAAFNSADRVLRLMTAFLPACSVNSANVKRNAEAACVTITELADTLVRDEGLTFRQAHEIAAHTSRACIREQANLGEGYVAFVSAFKTATGHAPTLTEEAFREAVSMEGFVSRRDRFGGPAPAALSAAFDTYRTDLVDLMSRSTSRAIRRKNAQHALDTAFKALLEA